MASRVRPREGWRVFVGEVGVIVLGVLIALGAQQAADEWRWRQDVTRTKADLDNELLINVATGVERVAVNRCLTGRLTELGKAIAASDGRWNANPFQAGRDIQTVTAERALPVVYRAPSRVFTTDAWEQAKSTGILNHMKSEEVAHYSAMYEQIADLRSLNKEEWQTIPRLASLAFDGSMDSDLRERALSTVATLDSYNALIVLVVRQIAAGAEQLEGQLSAEAINNVRDTLISQRALRGGCVDADAAIAELKPLMRA